MSGLERQALASARACTNAGLLLSGALLLVSVGCRTVDRTLEELHLPCGVYRWPIKTLTDPDRDSIRWKPAETAVRDLVVLPRPPEGYPAHHRAASELRLYRVRALLTGVHPRVDQDLHLLLRDPANPEARMLGEIPDPRCAPGSHHEADFASARRVAEAIQARSEPVMVEVWGIGFFDAVRDQIGGAPNGFELHPVVRLLELRE
jgi:hypothetical protein